MFIIIISVVFYSFFTVCDSYCATNGEYKLYLIFFGKWATETQQYRAQAWLELHSFIVLIVWKQRPMLALVAWYTEWMRMISTFQEAEY